MLKQPAEVQVVEQINLINRSIKKSINNLDINEQVLEVKYEDVCKNPMKTIHILNDFFKKNNTFLKFRMKPPNSFVIKSQKKLPKNLMKKLDDLVSASNIIK